MKLVASLIVGETEAERYLQPCLAHLLAFCDEAVLLLDGDPGWADEHPWIRDDRIVLAVGVPPVRFFEHEGRARQQLLDVTLRREPDAILAIDCDEFVVDGAALRATLEREIAPSVWNLCMMEVWGADADGLRIRQDGGWVEHDVPIVYAPGRLSGLLQIPDRALASGRTPTATRGPRASHTGTGILHWGWANVAERAARYQRYVDHDGGRFHAGSHIESIMLPDERVTLNEWGWPPALLPYRDAILAHAGVKS